MSAPQWTEILDCTGKDQKPRSTLSNAVAVLQHDPTWGLDVLWYDEFLDRILCRDESGVREWRDRDDTRLTVYLQQTIGMSSIAETQVASAVRYVAGQRTRHCVRDYLSPLVWDGVERIAHALIDYWGAQPTADQPEDYLLAVSANLFIGIVARVMRPGCQLDTMIVLEGAQGIGKSQSLRIIGGNEGLPVLPDLEIGILRNPLSMTPAVERLNDFLRRDLAQQA